MVRAGGPPAAVRLLPLMDPPEHRRMRSVLNNCSPRGRSPLSSRRSRRSSTSTSTRSTATNSTWCESSPRRSQSKSSRPCSVYPEEHVQHTRLWTDESMHREPGQIETDERESGEPRVRQYCTTASSSTENSPRRLVHDAHRRRHRTGRRPDESPHRRRNRRLCNAIGRSRRRNRDQAPGQRRPSSSPRHPDQWTKLINDPDRYPPRSRSCCATTTPCSTTCGGR